VDSPSQPLSNSQRRLLEQRLRGAAGASPRRGTVDRVADGSRPASPAEQWLFLTHRSEVDAPAFNTISSFRVFGTLDLPRFERAVRGLLARHEPLRSAFTLIDGELQVVLHEQVEAPIAVVACVDSDDQKGRAEAIGRRPFDVGCAPLIRWAYLTAPGAAPLLVLAGSDLVLDHWSVGIVWTEIDALYRADGDTLALPPLTARYADVAAAQQQQMASVALQSQLRFWTERLQELPPPLPLPTDRPYPRTLTYDGTLQHGRISPALADRIRRLAAAENASPFMLAFTGFLALLHRYTGTTDLVVGTPIANRRSRETARLIGLLLTTVAIRGRVDASVTGREILRQVRTAVLEALENQDAPFDRVVASVSPPRVPGRHPVFQVMLVYQTAAEAPEERYVGDVVLREELLGNAASPFDLTLFVVDAGEGMQTILEYRTDLFDSDSAARLLDHFAQLLESLVAHPDRPIGELQLMTAAEQAQVRRFSRGDPFPVADLPDVVAQIRSRAANNPDVPAVIGSRSTLSYGELIATADDVAARLLEAGEFSRRPVALVAERQASSIAAVLGILQAGAAYVPIDPEYPRERVRFIARDARIDTAVTSTREPESLEGIVRHAVLLGEAGRQRSRAISARPLGSADPAYIIYTSGSTGEPKGVVVSHENLASSTEARVRFYSERPGRFLLIPSLSFDSSVAVIFWTLSQGGTLVIADEESQRDPQALCSLVAEHGVTDLLCIPLLHREMLLQRGRALKTLRRAILAGEACTPEVVALHYERLPGARLFNEYGPTEATVWATVHECSRDDAAPGRPVPIGRPIPNGEVFVLDAQRQIVPIGVPGELYLGGSGVAVGYHGREALTSERFVECAPVDASSRRLYRTGDRGRWCADGRLQFLGRMDEQLKIRGYRIEPREIEAVLEQHPSVRRAAVVSVPGSQADVVPVDDLLRMIESMHGVPIETVLREIESLSQEEVRRALAAPEARSTPGVRIASGHGFRIELHTAPGFISPPRDAQRRWFLSRALEEFADDLQHLDATARSFVRGTDLSAPFPNLTYTSLTEQEIMEEWQVPLMRVMAAHVAAAHGDVLEIGFGRGVSGEFIQQIGVRSHTIVEPDEHIVSRYFEPWRARHADRDISLLRGRWQEIEDRLNLFDGIFFHAVPLDEREFADHMLSGATFAEHAFGPMARHLRPDGVFTYLTTEIDSLSRRHQRRLFEHFREFAASVAPLRVPEDTRDLWWAQSMVVVKAVK
jgi:amino acid adenylation domain-containing protein